ncbi:MAG: tryptophan--tRNA ligase [Bdellovibrionota bacterium]
MKKRSLTGIKPTGEAHLGNYLGMLKPALELQSSYECYYFIADLHALTTERDPKAIESQTLDIAAMWIAFGLDYNQHILWRQSDLPVVTELSWYLNCVTGVGLHQKSHAYKDAIDKGDDPNMGLFNYPALMAADILLFDSDVVPVGKDQKQHVEFTRDMAGSFNAIYGEEVLKLPEPLIREEVMIIPGTDGQKMSKRYGNIIPLFTPEKALRKKVLGITTDSSEMDDPKEINDTLFGQYFSLFASKDQYRDLRDRMLEGGLGWGHAKDELFQLINDQLKEPRERFNELRTDEDALWKILDQGTQKAFATAEPIINRVRKAVGNRAYGFGLK